MKKLLLALAFAGFCFTATNAQQREIPHVFRTNDEIYNRRTEIILPQVKGFNCYKADFHVHTSYSDGWLTPAARVAEAWGDGLDIMAITDHYENYRNFKKIFKVAAPFNEDGKPTKYTYPGKSGRAMLDFNAIHEEAVERRDKAGYNLLLIKGCEMARNSKILGHFNCLFVDDLNNLYNKDLSIAFDNVHAQGGLVIHNHPAYVRGTTDKSKEQAALYDAGKIDGIEVMNSRSFYPPIIRRCVEEKLFMVGGSDIHQETSRRFGSMGEYRTMTFVFAKELTEAAVKEALLKRRTLSYSCGYIVGEEHWLVEFLNAAVNCQLTSVDKKNEVRTFQLTNTSSLTYRMRHGKDAYELEPFKSVTITLGKDKESGKYLLPTFEVESMWHIDYQHPVIKIEIDK